MSEQWAAVQLWAGAPPTGIPDDTTAAAILDRIGVTPGRPDGLTARGLAELISHEAIVLEAYKDSVGVWTWGIGVTDKSGHKVGRYKDNPQPLSHVLAIFLWLVETKYLPAVLRAFEGHVLTEAQLHAALSFHYNTGAIGTASWVREWKAGKVDAARESFMAWRKPPEIIARRTAERDLFFDGVWSGDGTTTVWPVRKPSYSPDWGKGKKVNVLAELEALL